MIFGNIKVVLQLHRFWLVVWNMNFMTFHILGISSSQDGLCPIGFFMLTPKTPQKKKKRERSLVEASKRMEFPPYSVP